MNGHFARKFRTVKTGNPRGRGRNNNRAKMRQVNLIGRDDGHSESGRENDEVILVLHVNASGNQPSVLKRKRNKESFTAMIDSGSLITVFSPADLRILLKVYGIFARPISRSGKTSITLTNS